MDSNTLTRIIAGRASMQERSCNNKLNKKQLVSNSNSFVNNAGLQTASSYYKSLITKVPYNKPCNK